jgi:hypothetical protein
MLLPSALAGLRKKVDALYRLRIAIDYAADAVSPVEAESGLDIVREVFQLIARHTGWQP